MEAIYFRVPYKWRIFFFLHYATRAALFDQMTNCSEPFRRMKTRAFEKF